MKKKFKYIIFIIFILITVGMVGAFYGTRKPRNYKKAVVAMYEEKYDIAIDVFDRLDDYRDSKKLYAKCKEEQILIEDNEKPVIKNIPEQVILKQDEVINWDEWVNENAIKVSDNVSEDIKLVIEDSKIIYDSPGEYTLILFATDEAGNTAEEKLDVIIEYHPVYAAYLNAVNLTDSKLIKASDASYNYNNIHISQDEVGHIEAGSIYRSIAQQLEGYYIFDEEYYGNWGTDIMPLVFGIEKPENWSDAKELVNGVVQFVSPHISLGEIMNQFEKLSSVTGNFDYVNGIFQFNILDLTTTANELNITESMLGYILAKFEEYAPKTEFSNNTYSLDLVVVGQKEDKTILEYDDFETDVNFGSQSNELDFLGKNNEYHYYFSDRKFAIDIPKNRQLIGFFTNRGITLESSYNGVLFAYGQGDKQAFDTDNIMYQTFKYYDDLAYIVLDECTNYMTYTYENDKGQIVFYFNERDEIVMIVYTSVVIF